MNAAAFADLVEARRTARGRWQARCPAHEDRLPSLSICERPDSRILVHCFAGCTVPAILAALRLKSRDLFAGPPSSLEEALADRAICITMQRETASQTVARFLHSKARSEVEPIRALQTAWAELHRETVHAVYEEMPDLGFLTDPDADFGCTIRPLCCSRAGWPSTRGNLRTLLAD
jgi:hypothetical protein